MSAGTPPQAIILAGGSGSGLYPLNTAGVPKVLLPVANRPLLTFPLQMLEEAGVVEVLVVCEGETAASAVRSWLPGHNFGQLHVEVVRVSEGLPSVAALRQVMDRVKTESFVLLSGDAVTDAPLRAQLLTHHLKCAAVTALFGRRRSSPAADTQPGKAPRNVDYVGLADGDRLAFFAHSPEAIKELRPPQSLLRRHPRLALTTRLADMQVYVFSTPVVAAVLEARPEFTRLEEDLVSYLVRHQGSMPPEVRAVQLAQRSNSGCSSIGSALSTLNEPDAGATSTLSMGGSSHELGGLRRGPLGSAGWSCAAFVAPEGCFCQRANTLKGYHEVNHEAVTPALALRLLREAPTTRFENFVAPGLAVGAKTTVGAACMVGTEGVMGDKCSIKRSVLGRNCVLGNNVKIINSVLMDSVGVGDNIIIQNSIICSGSHIGANVQLRDCHVGPGFQVPGGSDLKGEVLCLKPPAPAPGGTK